MASVGAMLRSGFRALPARISCMTADTHATLGSLRCLVRSSVYLPFLSLLPTADLFGGLNFRRLEGNSLECLPAVPSELWGMVKWHRSAV